MPKHRKIDRQRVVQGKEILEPKEFLGPQVRSGELTKPPSTRFEKGLLSLIGKIAQSATRSKLKEGKITPQKKPKRPPTPPK